MSDAPRVLLFGGSFNPIHHGHLLMAQHTAERLTAERVVLIPSARPPHKSAGLADPQHRLAMTRLAVAGVPGFEVSDCELARPGASFTFHTVSDFRQRLPDAQLFWLIGGDSLGELITWHRIAELVELCTFVTAARPGFPREAGLERLAKLLSPQQVGRLAEHIIEDGPLVSLASRELRARAAVGRSLRWAVPEAVCRYIEEHGLYRNADTVAPSPATDSDTPPQQSLDSDVASGTLSR